MRSLRIFGLDRTARHLGLTSAIAGLLDSSCIVFHLFICLSQNLVVRRDQRNQKKAYREDLGRRARPAQSKQCSRRRRLHSFWLKARHVYVLSQVNVLQHLSDLLRPNTLDPCLFSYPPSRTKSQNTRPNSGVSASTSRTRSRSFVALKSCPTSPNSRSQAPPPIRTYSPSRPAKRSLNLSIPFIINPKHSIQDVLDLARDARVVPHIVGKG